ncbi:hypothetical protein HN51_023661 [Arachis hypogaea]
MMRISHHTIRVKIYIFPGICRERVHVPKSKPYISFIGKSNIMMNATELNNVTEIGSAILLLPVITNSTKASDKGSMEGQELGMSNTATLWVQSDFFCATVLTIDITKPIMGFQKKKKILYILLHDKYICMVLNLSNYKSNFFFEIFFNAIYFEFNFDALTM